jgi:hypothetical protein
MRSFRPYIILLLIYYSFQGFAVEINNEIILTNDDQKTESSEAGDLAPIEILSPTEDDVFKRGQMIEIRWSGGNATDEYALDLFNGKYHYRHLGELKNSGVYPWAIPTDVAPGKEYKFKLTNTTDFSEFAFGETFEVKRKIPLVVWLVPGGVLITGIAILIFSSDSSSDIPDLPGPIEPNR